jgi:predicted NAD/FAD-binding protein
MDDGVQVRLKGEGEQRYDHVIIATHADQVLPLLEDASADETELLGCWHYVASRTLLHTDPRVMPPLRRVWSSWNFQRIEGAQTCLTYHMNRLQGLVTEREYFVSLKPPWDPEGIIAEFNYMHPTYTREALERRPRLQALNGQRNTWFAGSYFGNGFHEDAVRSAVDVARGFGMEL